MWMLAKSTQSGGPVRIRHIRLWYSMVSVGGMTSLRFFENGSIAHRVLTVLWQGIIGISLSKAPSHLTLHLKWAWSMTSKDRSIIQAVTAPFRCYINSVDWHGPRRELLSCWSKGSLLDVKGLQDYLGKVRFTVFDILGKILIQYIIEI